MSTERKIEPLVRIVDDDVGLLKAISFMLNLEGWQTVAYSNPQQFLQQDDPSIPGCLLLDVRMPEVSGLQLQEMLNQKGYPHPIIFLTAHGDVEMAVGAMEQGAFTFLQKPIDDGKLIAAIARALKADAEKHHAAPDKTLAEEAVASLTRREKEIFHWIVQGHTNRFISLELDISERTVEAHRASLYKKLHVNSTAGLLEVAALVGLVQ